MKYLVLIAFLLGSHICAGQSRGDSILLSERTMDRPLNVHKGQLRVSGGYRLGLHTIRFDDEGQRLDLTDGGLSFASNTLSGEAKYGILEFLQLSLAFAYLDQAIKEPTNYIIAGGFTEVNSMDVYNGLTDLSVGLDFRAPFKNRRIDLLLSASSTLPTADHNPALPSHSVSTTSVGQSSATSVNYQYNQALGNGTPVVAGGLTFKYRFDNWAFTLAGSYVLPTSDVVTSYYNSQLVSSSFENQQVFYRFQRPDEIRAYGEIEYQLFPWFDLIGEMGYVSTSGGFSEETGTRVVPEPTSLLSAGPGFEIIITHRVWFRQRVILPIAGTNSTGPTNYSATISYNLFVTNR